MADFKGFGRPPAGLPSFDQLVLLGVQDLLRRSYQLAAATDAIEQRGDCEWFPLIDDPEMRDTPAWREGRGIRNLQGDYFIAAKTMAAMTGMPFEHFEHRIQADLGIDITPVEELGGEG